MSQIALIFGSFFGILSIVLGAFGAHALKNKLTSEQSKSFETGVKYQMYHAIVLLIVGYNINQPSKLLVYSFIAGVILFSFSIYGLVLSDAFGKKLRFLGPITPLGGIMLIIGWFLLLLNTFTNY
jgi:uncharacterized membrane protein YgdD (TMEM256/DUF423 family)